MKNRIEVSLKEFIHSIAAFKPSFPRKNAKKPPNLPPAMLSFQGEFLTIEFDDKLVNMHAEGEWHGKAEFSGTFLQAIVLEPIGADPVVIEYDGDKLTIGSAKTVCRWTPFSHSLLKKVSNPTAIDTIAMWRTLPADIVHVEGIDEKYKATHERMLKETEKAAKLLTQFEITQQDIIDLIEIKVEARSKIGL